MKEFNEEHIKDLQEVGGFVLQNVIGNTVAIGIDSEYPDIASFLDDYINEYGLWALSYELRHRNEREMLNDSFNTILNFPFPVAHIKTKLMGAFNGISADDYAKKLEEKQWHLGDIVEDDEGRRAMIVKDHDGDYVLMNIIPNHRNAFNICNYFDFSNELSTLSLKNPDWHKVVEE